MVDVDADSAVDSGLAVQDDVATFSEIAEDQVGYARKTVAANAIDAADAAELMMALGIHPSQEIKGEPLMLGVTNSLSRLTQRPTPSTFVSRPAAPSI